MKNENKTLVLSFPRHGGGLEILSRYFDV